MLQLSLVSQREWSSLFSRASDLGDKCLAAPAKRLSLSIRDAMPPLRRVSTVSQISMEQEMLDEIAIKALAAKLKTS